MNSSPLDRRGIEDPEMYNMEFDEAMQDLTYDEALEEAYFHNLLEKSLKQISDDSVRTYLGSFGKSVEKRVDKCLEQARALHKLGCYSPAIILSAIATEVVLGYLIVRPLVQGAVLGGEWADILVRRIFSSRNLKDYGLLQKLLTKWEINLNCLCLSDGSSLWSYLKNVLWPKRNRIVHQGESSTDEASRLISEKAIESAEALLRKVVYRIASNLGFTTEQNAVYWPEAEWKTARGRLQRTGYEPCDAFQ